MKNKTAISLLSVVFLSLIFLFVFYGKILISPNQYLFSTDGDGIKNYYTYAYFIKNNVSNTNFEGFNYPYGEHYFYTDCHPLLASVFKIIASYFPGFSNYTIGIINFLMVISFLIGAVFLFLIFKELKINMFLAVLSSFAIMVLSPQIFRLGGHYALSYSFFIPLTFYLLIKLEKSKNKLKFSVLLLINNLFWLLIHTYLGMIVIAFLLSYGIVKVIYDLKYRLFNYTATILFFLQAVIPILCYVIFVKVTDVHTARTSNPYGFFEYYADFDTVLLPNHNPLKALFDLFLPEFTQTWEGWSYIGFIAIVTFAIYFIYLFLEIVRRKKVNSWIFSSILIFILISSFIILLFSNGFPFSYGLEEYLDYIPILKQFRAIGRFAWIFFFAINISAVYLINYFVEKQYYKTKKYLAYLIVVLAPLIIFIEGFSAHSEVSKSIIQSENLFDQRQLSPPFIDAVDKIDANNYQAIIPLPFYNIGSENFIKTGTDKIYKISMLLSYHFNLPIIGSYLTRTSLMESKKIMQLFSNSFYAKELQEDIHLNKDFLMIYSKEDISDNEMGILEKGKLIFSSDPFDLYEISKESLFFNSAKTEIDKFIGLKETLMNYNCFLTDDTNSFILYNDFEDFESDFVFRGEGAFAGMKNDTIILATINSGDLQSEEPYVASLWLYNNNDQNGQDQLTNLDFLQRTILEEEVVHEISVKPMNSMIINNNWTLVELEFTGNIPDAKLEFVLYGYDHTNREIYIDDLFIYPKESVYYKIEDKEGEKISTLFMNNHMISVP